MKIEINFAEGFAKALQETNQRGVEVYLRPEANQYGAFIEYGTKNMVARPFFFSTIFKNIVSGTREALSSNNIGMLGIVLTNELKRFVTELQPSATHPPLKIGTALRKGSFKLLVDTGVLKNSFTHKEV